MEPSQSRKKRSLHKILQDFPDKKFVCVGDSGEYDLEAYVDIAKTFPNQVLSINIRYVEDSFSDIDDRKIYNELIRLLTTTKKEIPVSPKIHSSPKRKPPPKQLDEEMDDLIDLSEDTVVKKPAPIVPRKPTSLKGQQIGRKIPPHLQFQEEQLCKQISIQSQRVIQILFWNHLNHVIQIHNCCCCSTDSAGTTGTKI